MRVVESRLNLKISAGDLFAPHRPMIGLIDTVADGALRMRAKAHARFPVRETLRIEDGLIVESRMDFDPAERLSSLSAPEMRRVTR